MKKLILSSLIILLSFTLGCKKEETIEETPAPAAPSLFKQYASTVIGYSSQYSNPNFYAVEALGEPNVYPTYADAYGTWAPSSADNQREHLVLGFDSAHTVKKIQIYETFNPGAVDTIYLRNSVTQAWNQVWSGTASAKAAKARIFTVNITETSYTVDAIRIAINSQDVMGWNEIDAVAVSGTKK